MKAAAPAPCGRVEARGARWELKQLLPATFGSEAVSHVACGPSHRAMHLATHVSLSVHSFNCLSEHRPTYHLATHSFIHLPIHPSVYLTLHRWIHGWMDGQTNRCWASAHPLVIYPSTSIDPPGLHPLTNASTHPAVFQPNELQLPGDGAESREEVPGGNLHSGLQGPGCPGSDFPPPKARVCTHTRTCACTRQAPSHW